MSNQYINRKGKRYTVVVDEELLNAIDDFRFENRYPSRNAAVIALIEAGIDKQESNSEDEVEED